VVDRCSLPFASLSHADSRGYRSAIGRRPSLWRIRSLFLSFHFLILQRANGTSLSNTPRQEKGFFSRLGVGQCWRDNLWSHDVWSRLQGVGRCSTVQTSKKTSRSTVIVSLVNEALNVGCRKVMKEKETTDSQLTLRLTRVFLYRRSMSSRQANEDKIRPTDIEHLLFSLRLILMSVC
jgi:hypothetical protein